LERERHYKKVSISTIRRHIKVNLVKWKEVEGKYLIWTPAATSDIDLKRESELMSLKFELQRLKLENRRLAEELAEAKMLIGLYEGNPSAAGDVHA
jgi:hydrogenase maturation factor